MTIAYAWDGEIAVQPSTGIRLDGRLSIPEPATGCVVFVHGSGSSRHSPRNQFVARTLHTFGLGTLLFDLLTPAEAADRGNVFDIELLADRVHAARTWLATAAQTHGMSIGLFGASTGAAAALTAAAREPSGIGALVSRGGRPDLAGDWLAQVRAPTLLIVGALDHHVLRWNEDAAARLHCKHQVAVIPGATHLFEEPGTLSVVADLAGQWFTDHLSAAGSPQFGRDRATQGER